MSKKRKSGKKIIILTAAALIAAVCGYLLLSSPAREQKRIEDKQEAMIEDILRDINGAEDMPEETEDTTDLSHIEETEDTDCGLYDEDYSDYEDETADEEPETLSVAVYEPVFTDPLPDNSFPADTMGIGILTIESINLRLPIAEGIEYAPLRIAPGRVPQTAQIGDIGNAVIAGHRNYTYGSMFNRLGEIEFGDLIQYQARNGELMEFTVFEIAVIEPENQIAFLQPLNESIITLYTCTPIREATHRLIIRAQRIS